MGLGTYKPQSSYLIMLAAGNWEIIADKWNGIPVYTYVPPGTVDMAYTKDFARAADIIRFYSEKIGYKYAWPGFSQVIVEDFIYGGMENTGAVVLTDVAVYDDKTSSDYNATGLIAHELAHQWWGDVVTCRNWSEIWLNESFATYFQCLYSGHAFGKDEFDYNIFRNGNGAIEADSTVARKPIYSREGLTVNTYDKGSVVLNMLHNLLGDDVFWKAMNTYITDNQFDNVVTQNLIDAVNKAAYDPRRESKQKDYKWFFDEWVYKAGQPEYKASYTYDENLKQVKISCQQVQKIDSTTSVFQTPLSVEIVTAGSSQTMVINPTDQPKDYALGIDSKPLSVIFNKGNRVLCKLYCTKPKEDWLYQLKKSDDAIDRITAIRGLKDFINDSDVVNALVATAMLDPFWGTRNEAIEMLSNSNSSAALSFYIIGMKSDADSRVRRACIENIPKFIKNNPKFADEIVKTRVTSLLTEMLSGESRYYTIAGCISALAEIMPKDKIYDAVSSYAENDSHNEVIRRNVLEALRKSGDIRSLDIFKKYAVSGSTSRLRNAAIEGLGVFIDKKDVIDFLNNLLGTTTSRFSQFGIISQLEKAKDPSSKPFLQALYDKTDDEGLRKRITKALEEIK